MNTETKTNNSRSPKKVIPTNNLPENLKKLANLNREGTTKLFTPEQLYTNAITYFEDCKKNPIKSSQLITGGAKAGEIREVNKPRLFTLQGLMIHLGVNMYYLQQLESSISGKTDELSLQYSIVINYIRSVITKQRYEYASVNEFNPMFIAKLEGLSDKVEHSGEVKQTVTNIEFIQRNIQDAEFTEVKNEIDNF